MNPRVLAVLLLATAILFSGCATPPLPSGGGDGEIAGLQGSEKECERHSECNDFDSCTIDVCSAEDNACINTRISACLSGDGCCPPGCVGRDSDCVEGVGGVDQCYADSECVDNDDSTKDLCYGSPKRCFHLLKKCWERNGEVCESYEACPATYINASDSARCCPVPCTYSEATAGSCAYVKCPSSKKCVDGECVYKSCSEMGGDICSSSEGCPGHFIESSDSTRCCTEECEGESYLTCFRQHGTKCDTDEQCRTPVIPASDSGKCCLSTCYLSNIGDGLYTLLGGERVKVDIGYMLKLEEIKHYLGGDYNVTLGLYDLEDRPVDTVILGEGEEGELRDDENVVRVTPLRITGGEAQLQIESEITVCFPESDGECPAECSEFTDFDCCERSGNEWIAGNFCVTTLTGDCGTGNWANKYTTQEDNFDCFCRALYECADGTKFTFAEGDNIFEYVLNGIQDGKCEIELAIASGDSLYGIYENMDMACKIEPINEPSQGSACPQSIDRLFTDLITAASTTGDESCIGTLKDELRINLKRCEENDDCQDNEECLNNECTLMACDDQDGHDCTIYQDCEATWLDSRDSDSCCSDRCVTASFTTVKIGNGMIEFTDTGGVGHVVPLWLELADNGTGQEQFDNNTFYYHSKRQDVDVRLGTTAILLNGISRSFSDVSSANVNEEVTLDEVTYRIIDKDADYAILRADGNVSFAIENVFSDPAHIGNDLEYLETQNYNNSYYLEDKALADTEPAFTANPLGLVGTNLKVFEYGIFFAEGYNLLLLLNDSVLIVPEYGGRVALLGTDTSENGEINDSYARIDNVATGGSPLDTAHYIVQLQVDTDNDGQYEVEVYVDGNTGNLIELSEIGLLKARFKLYDEGGLLVTATDIAAGETFDFSERLAEPLSIEAVTTTQPGNQGLVIMDGKNVAEGITLTDLDGAGPYTCQKMSVKFDEVVQSITAPEIDYYHSPVVYDSHYALRSGQAATKHGDILTISGGLLTIEIKQ